MSTTASPVDLMPIGIPVSPPTSDDPMGGNRSACATFPAPPGKPTPAPASRPPGVRHHARAEPAIGFLDLVRQA